MIKDIRVNRIIFIYFINISSSVGLSCNLIYMFRVMSFVYTLFEASRLPSKKISGQTLGCIKHMILLPDFQTQIELYIRDSVTFKFISNLHIQKPVYDRNCLLNSVCFISYTNKCNRSYTVQFRELNNHVIYLYITNLH